MSELTAIAVPRLVPVVELAPSQFATQEHPYPKASGAEDPAGWEAYWRASLADAGLVGLRPIRPGSYHVAADELDDPKRLSAFLTRLVEEWGGAEAWADPETRPVLDGGLALFDGDRLLVEPQCCVDLSNLTAWREGAAHRATDWSMLWTGHPWLSVRFDAGRLILSQPHESKEPVARWSVDPDALARAADAAEAALKAFAGRARPVLTALNVPDPPAASRRLVGLPA